EHRLAALASISSGLSCGRLIGPRWPPPALSVHPQMPALADGARALYRAAAGGAWSTGSRRLRPSVPG
ncbi:hypothetical protein, partial [Cronobacter sakazakii]|uniref:hypothetical protein n=1 Tax=Cronobacter sakazakii TaxID=28141 RepID=UPI00387B572A